MTITDADREKARECIGNGNYYDEERERIAAALADERERAYRDGAEQGRGDMEYFEKKWRAEEGEKVRARFLAIADRIENLGVGPFDPIHKVYAEAIRRALEDGP